MKAFNKRVTAIVLCTAMFIFAAVAEAAEIK
jgi:hypothetical protein